jgi:DNA-directed RNA polymerase subunit alpha
MKKIKTAPFLPTEVEVNEISETRAQVIAYPFENGYAITLAHPLRRLLLGSSIGYAPISLKIEGAAHEFDSIRGMHEDIAIFIINFKSVRFRIKDESERAVASYSFKGPRTVYAKDLDNDEIEAVNGDVVLATLNEDAELNFTVEMAKGIGYVPSEDLREGLDEDVIVLDAFFTPVKRANYTIENVLVEDNPDYEKIVFDIETDGQITPMEAFANALETMSKQLSVFGNVLDLDLSLSQGERAGNSGELKQFIVPIDVLGLSARSFNSLDKAGIKYIGELVMMSEKELKDIKNLGQRSLTEIQEILAERGFGSDFELDEETRSLLSKKIAQLKE